MNTRAKIFISLTLLFIFQLLLSCKTENEEAKSSSQQSLAPVNHEVEKNPRKKGVISSLVHAIKKDSLVLLGESSHGIQEFYQLKAKIVTHLYQKEQFDVLFFESGMLDIAYAYQNLKSTTESEEFLSNCIYYKSKDLLPIFDLIKETKNSKRPLIVAGFDVQSPNIDVILQSLTGKYFGLDTLKKNLFRNAFKKNINAYNKTAKVYVKRLETIENSLSKINNKSDFYLILNQVISQQKIYYGHQYENSFEKEFSSHIQLRDSLMNQNLLWLYKTRFNKKKVMVWAHNAHIMSNDLNPDQVMLGERISKEFPANSYSLGLIACKGMAFEQYPQKETLKFNHLKQGTIENFYFKKAEHFPSFFSSLSEDTLTISNNTRSYEKIIPSKAFDGIILLDTVRAENYLNF